MRIHTNLQSAVAEAIAVPEANAAPKLIAVPELVEAATAETPTTSDVEARLAKLGDLHSRGVISDEELAAARLKILAE